MQFNIIVTLHDYGATQNFDNHDKEKLVVHILLFS